jgi:hypothetical protein
MEKQSHNIVVMNCQALLLFAMLSLCCHYVHAVKTASLLVSINQERDQIQFENGDSSPITSIYSVELVDMEMLENIFNSHLAS